MSIISVSSLFVANHKFTWTMHSLQLIYHQTFLVFLLFTFLAVTISDFCLLFRSRDLLDRGMISRYLKIFLVPRLVLYCHIWTLTNIVLSIIQVTPSVQNHWKSSTDVSSRQSTIPDSDCTKSRRNKRRENIRYDTVRYTIRVRFEFHRCTLKRLKIFLLSSSHPGIRWTHRKKSIRGQIKLSCSHYKFEGIKISINSSSFIKTYSDTYSFVT